MKIEMMSHCTLIWLIAGGAWLYVMLYVFKMEKMEQRVFFFLVLSGMVLIFVLCKTVVCRWLC